MRRVWEKESVGREPDLGSGAGIAQEAGSWLMLKNRTGHLSFPLDFLPYSWYDVSIEKEAGRMEKKAMQETVKEMMEQWDAKRSEWIAKKGNEDGFSKWFTDQIGVAVN